MSLESLSPSAQKFQSTLHQLGFDLKVVELPNSTRTALEAAVAIGCQVEQIVKSLVFKGKRSLSPYLVLACGSNRVSEQKIEAIIGEPLGKADADFVREHTGFTIGGVPPAGHQKPLKTLIDEDLLHYSQIWAAAGTPNAVFCLSPNDLLRMTNGQACDLKQ
jgi:prolyl-tRNA editing enzyme YbaK/EbsC (Cys-tRNA(Pro) deacylase)